MHSGRAPLALFLVIFAPAVALLTSACIDDTCNPVGIVRYDDGASPYTLITNGYRNVSYRASQIILFDHDANRPLWIYEAPFAGGLENAHNAEFHGNEMILTDTDHYRVLIAEARNGIYSPFPDFQVVWNSMTDAGYVFQYPNDANFLPNGNLLITERDKHRIIELNRDTGEIVWQFGVEGYYGKDDSHLHGPHNADRLPNGNTIVADSRNDRILEIDPQGNIVWRYPPFPFLDPLQWPRDADVLDNNDVLIADSLNGRVLEITRQGEIVWEFGLNVLDTMWAPYEADLLDNGHVLISFAGIVGGAVLEVDYATKEVVWSYPPGSY